FRPAIDLAEQGFEVSPRLHALIADNPGLADKPAARAYFLDEQGRPWPVGHRLRNPAYAQVLKVLAQQGADAFYTGELARDMAEAVLRDYRALCRERLCRDRQRWALCGMAPPSSGPLTLMQMLGTLQHTAVASLEPQSARAIHYFAEAGRLAFADRDAWVAD